MISDSRVFTGYDAPLLDPLNEAISGAERIDIITSFTKVTGVNEILPGIRKAVAKGVKIRFLTGTYLDITDPSAVRMLKDVCGENIDIRFYKGTNSFHPKAYFFYKGDSGCLFIGSSNLSRSALVDGVEWNYKILRSESPREFDRFREEFEKLFTDVDMSYEATDEAIEEYRLRRVPPRLPVRQEAPGRVFEKNDVQVEALFNLGMTRESGMDKALVVAATGTGKTVLAAFDSCGYRKVLFVAHTEDILRQARETFSAVRKGDSSGMCCGGEFDIEKDMTFATVQTLSRDNNLDRIPADHFDYIVIDEFHHAAADSYRKVIDHFRPKFLLGLTATPERMDNKDVFVLCDYNVVYEIDLREAIERQYLCRFRYYGIYDGGTDYSRITYVNGRYREDELTRALANEVRARLILDNYLKYGSRRCMGFCSSIDHAEFMASFFVKNGIDSAAVSSRGGTDREEAKRALEEGRISVVFSVDMFNEGVDVPSLDMVMFLRPTESPTVFMQQLGRGLRLSEGKDFLTVLDFIGNYRNAELIPSMLTGRRGGGHTMSDMAKGLPDGCFADFDLEVIRLFDRMGARRKKSEIRDGEYLRVREELGHAPSRCELFSMMDPEKWKLFRLDPKVNPFKDYIGYLRKIRDLDTDRSELLGEDALAFIRMVENTSMSRMYKIPLLLSMFTEDRVVFEPTAEQIAGSFREFYSRDNNMVDFEGIKTRKDRELTDDYWVKLAVENPIRFLCKSEPLYFRRKDDGLISLTDRLRDYSMMKEFIGEVRDALSFRAMDFKQSRYYGKEKE